MAQYMFFCLILTSTNKHKIKYYKTKEFRIIAVISSSHHKHECN